MHMKNAWLWIVLAALVLVLLLGWWWNAGMPQYANETGIVPQQMPAATTSDSSAISGRDNSDTSLSQDYSDISGQMSALDADASAADSAQIQ